MGFEPTLLCDLAGCSNHYAIEDSKVSKSTMWVYWQNHIPQILKMIVSGVLP